MNQSALRHFFRSSALRRYTKTHTEIGLGNNGNHDEKIEIAIDFQTPTYDDVVKNEATKQAPDSDWDKLQTDIDNTDVNIE
jgi:hypothetical protein